MNTNLISVVVPVYNKEKFIRECLSSILNNSYKNIEIIIIDDGSTDSSAIICDEFKNMYSNVNVWHIENHGLSYARNLGILNSKGDFITFIDADDVVDALYLENLLLPFLSNQNVDFSYCKFKEFYKNYNEAGKITNFEILNNIEFEDSNNSVEYVYRVISCAKLFKKSFINKFNFEVGRFHEDEYLYSKICVNCKFCAYIPSELYFYRKDMLSITHSKLTDKRHIDIIDAYFDRIELFDGIFECGNVLKKIEKALFREWEKPLNVNRIKRIRFFARFKLNSNLNFKLRLKYIFFLFFPLLTIFIKDKLIFTFFIFFIRFILYKPQVIYFGSVTHGNLGDQAICIASLKLLKDNNIKAIDLTQKEITFKIINYIKKHKNIIALRGGGNIGDIWIKEEEFHRFVINEFKDNKIIFFPESIYFSNSDEMRESSDIYSKHKDLTIFTRDRESYNRGIALFPNKIILVPDIVFYLKEKYFNQKEIKNICCVFRNDKEKITNNIEIDKLIDNLVSGGYYVRFDSTVIEERVLRKKRNIIVKNKLNDFKKFDLIITDRLHAMIFAYNLGKPVICFDNISKKVHSSAEWIKTSNIILTLFKYDNVLMEQFISGLKYHDEESIDFSNYFERIIKTIKQ